MLRTSLVYTIAVLLSACATRERDSDPADTARCTAMRDHLVDLRVSEVAAVDREPHRRALAATLGDDFIAECTRTLDIGQAKCTQTAATLADASACARPITH